MIPNVYCFFLIMGAECKNFICYSTEAEDTETETLSVPFFQEQPFAIFQESLSVEKTCFLPGEPVICSSNRNEFFRGVNLFVEQNLSHRKGQTEISLTGLSLIGCFRFSFFAQSASYEYICGHCL